MRRRLTRRSRGLAMTSKSKRKASKAQRIELGFLEGVRRRCPDATHVLKPLGDLYTRVGCYEEGLDVDLALTRLCPEDSEVWYNLGCSCALTSKPDEALKALARAIDLGYDDAEWMTHDEDLSALRDDPQFDALLERVRN